MNASHPRRTDVGALVRAPIAALQWRLLLLWLVFLLLPTAVVVLPAWRALGALVDHSVHAAAWARQFDALMFSDVMAQLGASAAWLNGASLLGALLALVLGPYLAGMTVAAGRARRVLGLGQLLQSGVIEYGRMFRVLLWSIAPSGVAVGIGALALVLAHRQSEHAVLERQADAAQHAALWVLGVALVLAHAVVESARAAFIADPGLRSATRALGRGLLQLVRRPLGTLLSYLLIGALGYAAALGLGIARLHTPAVGAGGFLLACLLGELVVVAVGWTRIARLFALAQVGQALVQRRGVPSAL